MSDQRHGWDNGTGRWGPYGSGGRRDSLLSCGESARWWQENRRSEEESTPNPPLFSPEGGKKTPQDINLIGLSMRSERSRLLIGGGAQNKRRGGFLLAARTALSARCHIIENVFYYCKTSCFTVAILCPSQRPDGALKRWRTVPTRLEDTARASLSLCSEAAAGQAERDKVWTTRCIRGDRALLHVAQGAAHKDGAGIWKVRSWMAVRTENVLPAASSSFPPLPPPPPPPQPVGVLMQQHPPWEPGHLRSEELTTATREKLHIKPICAPSVPLSLSLSGASAS